MSDPSAVSTTSATSDSRLVAYGQLTLAMVIVGAYVAMSKPLVAVFPVLLLAWLRFGIAAVMLLPWTFKPSGEPTWTASDKRTLFLQSFFGNFLFSICMLSGIALTSASAAGVILATIPAMTAIFALLLLSERLTPRAIIAIGLAVVGVSLLALPKSGGEMTLLGNALMFGATCCEALYVVFGRKLTGRLSAFRVSALINLCGLLLVTPFGIWQALRFDWSAPTLAHWLGLVAYACAASVLTVALWMHGLKRVPANQAGVFTVALPITAALVGVVVLNETLGLLGWAALAIAASGMVVMSCRGDL
jgi:drug/metabolite transporter (DMT)-like permease